MLLNNYKMIIMLIIASLSFMIILLNRSNIAEEKLLKSVTVLSGKKMYQYVVSNSSNLVTGVSQKLILFRSCMSV